MSDCIKVLISEEEIDKRIREVASQISEMYRGEHVHMVCVLKGGVYFMTELSKRIDPDVDVSIDFMSCSSYGDGTTSSGIVKITKDLDHSIEGKNVLIVEDIIDSGRTLSYLMDTFMRDRNPKTLRLCTLLNKPSRREVEVKVDFTCFDVDDLFVVGYGLDFAQKYRNLPFIGVVETEE
ncbi:MAG: hypoxanthine phosphoribosyltransferase [Lachnospiraceae bacterium]|jgi:hypoxanthine phosphoribosyltransferase